MEGLLGREGGHAPQGAACRAARGDASSGQRRGQGGAAADAACHKWDGLGSNRDEPGGQCQVEVGAGVAFTACRPEDWGDVELGLGGWLGDVDSDWLNTCGGTGGGDHGACGSESRRGGLSQAAGAAFAGADGGVVHVSAQAVGWSLAEPTQLPVSVLPLTRAAGHVDHDPPAPRVRASPPAPPPRSQRAQPRRCAPHPAPRGASLGVVTASALVGGRRRRRRRRGVELGRGGGAQGAAGGFPVPLLPCCHGARPGLHRAGTATPSP